MYSREHVLRLVSSVLSSAGGYAQDALQMQYQCCRLWAWKALASMANFCLCDRNDILSLVPTAIF